MFLACVHDRHGDPDFQLFKVYHQAADWALRRLVTSVAHPEHIRLEPRDGVHLAYWSHGVGTDCAWVRDVELPPAALHEEDATIYYAKYDTCTCFVGHTSDGEYCQLCGKWAI